MMIIPAIDLADNRVVRLKQGRFEDETVYADNPADWIKTWMNEGLKRLHVIDLDGAKSGRPVHQALIESMMRLGSFQVQVGGGIRDPKQVEAYLKKGVWRVILGTRVLLDEAFLNEMMDSFAPKLVIAVDTQDGFVATHGWTKITNIRIEEACERVLGRGGREILVTDIAKDGMLEGVNLPLMKRLLEFRDIQLIASGGVGQLKDIEALNQLHSERLLGVIVGKALYEKRFTLKEANELLQKAAPRAR